MTDEKQIVLWIGLGQNATVPCIWSEAMIRHKYDEYVRERIVPSEEKKDPSVDDMLSAIDECPTLLCIMPESEFQKKPWLVFVNNGYSDEIYAFGSTVAEALNQIARTRDYDNEYNDYDDDDEDNVFYRDEIPGDIETWDPETFKIATVMREGEQSDCTLLPSSDCDDDYFDPIETAFVHYHHTSQTVLDPCHWFACVSKHVSQPYFNLIRNGTKTYEGRVYKKYWAHSRVNDIIRFFWQDEEYYVQVTDVKRYDDFGQAYLDLGSKLLPDATSVDEATDIYRQWNSDETVEQYGVVCIGVALFE